MAGTFIGQPIRGNESMVALVFCCVRWSFYLFWGQCGSHTATAHLPAVLTPLSLRRDTLLALPAAVLKKKRNGKEGELHLQPSLKERYYSAYLMNCDLIGFVLLPCLAGREATGSQNLLKMRILLPSRRGPLKFHITYTCVSAEGSGVVTLFQA